MRHVLLTEDLHQMPDLVIDLIWGHNCLGNLFAKDLSKAAAEAKRSHLDGRFAGVKLGGQIGVGLGFLVSPKVRLQSVE